MKRSEMINQMESFVRYWDGHPNKRAIAEALLVHQENLGMLPPAARFPGIWTTEDDFGNVYPPDSVTRNKWEPEDETK